MTVTKRDQRIIDIASTTDEPTIVFRAQDRFSLVALYAYSEAVKDHADSDFVEVVEAAIAEFRGWQKANPDRVKTPDL